MAGWKHMRNRPRLPVKDDQFLRARIEATEIIDRFQQCVRGEIELTMAQVRAGTVLLHKVMPDMAPVDAGGNAQPVTIQIVRFSDKKRLEAPMMIDATPILPGDKP